MKSGWGDWIIKVVISVNLMNSIKANGLCGNGDGFKSLMTIKSGFAKYESLLLFKLCYVERWEIEMGMRCLVLECCCCGDIGHGCFCEG